MADDTSKPVVDEVNGDSAKSQEEAKPIEDSDKFVADEKDTEKEPEEKGETKDEETEKKPDEKVEAKKEGESQPMPAKHIFGSGFSSGRGFGIVNSDGGLTGVAGAPSSFASCNTADSGFAKYTTKPKSFEVMLSDGSSKSLETATTEQKPKVVETVEIKTHEENETCVFSTKAKLFQFKDGDWKSRGKGHFKVNQHKIDEKCRLVMRTDITFQVMLNSMLFHGMAVRRRDEKSVFFVCIDHQSNKLASYILALDNEDLAQEAYSAIRNHIPGTVDNAAQKTEKVEVPDEGKSDDEDGAKLSGTESVAGDSSAEDNVKDAEN
ncbi:hypothetical protein FBU59_003713 [Linderina macrospora]|uniref:Uncharacterized protein n=1 Tax=Linderina macrospora TaxID=4868 RepID=A0ACC1J7K9_9FUNG|nr:hypothetical protein FBU59_003713 [Linderina macrospora]